MGATSEKNSEKKVDGDLGGDLLYIFFCSGLGAAQVGEHTALGAGC